jgi:phage-related protein
VVQAAEAKYTVFVGGSEVTDWHLTLNTAEIVCNFYKRQGYDDVAIVDVKTDKQITTTTSRQFPAANS